MSDTFLEAKEVLYDFIDSVSPKGQQDVSSVRAKIRGWLRERCAPANDVAAFAGSMGLTDEQCEEFFDLLRGWIDLLDAEDGQDAKTPPPFPPSYGMKQYPRLSKDESAEMFRIYQAGVEAEKKLNESGSELDSTEIRRLKLLVRKSQRARESLITGNWCLIVSQVRKYSGMGVPDEDLRHEGVLGLMRAMQSYDPGKSAFSTYATPWIRKNVMGAVTKQGRTIPLSQDAEFMRSRVNQVSADWEARTGRAPTYGDIAACTGFSEKRINNMCRNEWQSQSVSMEALLSDIDNRRVLESIIDPSSEAQYNAVLEQTEGLDIKKVLHESLRPLEERVILLRFGVEDGQPKPLAAVGAIMGYTKENVRQIEKKALAKLRKQERLMALL